MNGTKNAELLEEITEELKIELQNEPAFDVYVLENKVKNAIREVRMRRNYTATSYSETEIENDLYNYYSVIVNVARYDYNQIGVEGQASHSENNVSRSYADREKLFNGVHAFVKVL